MKKQFLIVALLFGVLLFSVGVVHATGRPADPGKDDTPKEEKVLLCHKTKADKNPWVVQEVKANEEQSHLDNGDKLYKGPVDEKGKGSDAWCNEQNPETPVVDVCDNIDGVQTTVPANHKQDGKNCTELDAGDYTDGKSEETKTNTEVKSTTTTPVETTETEVFYGK